MQDRSYFWIASYPRSGNTLVRVALSRILLPLPSEAQKRLDENFPEYVRGKPLPPEGTAFPGAAGDVVFLKTHCPDPAARAQFPFAGAVYLVRHPVDVFLSGMNYLYLEHQKIPGFRLFFGEDGPQPVERLAQRGRLDDYLDRFVAAQGLAPFRAASGSWVESVRRWTEAAGSGVAVLRYDDLVQDVAGALARILERVGISVPLPRFRLGIRAALEGTRPNGAFYWRGSSNTKYEFFSRERIAQVEDAFRPLVGEPYR
jgi:sulfotransferase family protein